MPSAPTEPPRAWAITPSAFRPDVLPWSCAVPIVVYRLTCSTDRRPAPVARNTAATVTSRCRSTKCVSSSSPGTSQSAWGGVTGGSSTVGNSSVPASNPTRRAASAPAAAPPASAPASENVPAAAPTTCRSAPMSDGTNVASSSEYASRPRAWLCRWTAGFQPPETSSTSHSREPPAAPRCAAVTRDEPEVPTTTCPASTSMPRSAQRSRQTAGASARASTTVVTVIPASARSIAAA